MKTLDQVKEEINQLLKDNNMMLDVTTSCMVGYSIELCKADYSEYTELTEWKQS